MTLSRSDLNTLCQIAEAAGRGIMDVYRNGGEIWQKDDFSPLTEADLRADRVIREELERHFPDVFILSEESVSLGTQTGGRFFLVDPLDGTKEFLKRNDEFTVNIALVEDGRLIAGVVLAPALEELFYAAQGLGAWKRDAVGLRKVATSGYDSARPLRVMGSRLHGGEKLDAWLAQLTKEHSFVAAGSSLKFCRIAEGKADIYPRFGPTSQWDTAAAQCVLELAGGVVTDLQGSPLRYGLDRPILNPEFAAMAAAELVSVVAAPT